MTATQKVFEYQIWHLFSLILLIFAIKLYVSSSPEILDGSFWGISTSSWFWLAIAIPIIHQIYVWLVWRLELYFRVFSKRLGVKRAFNIYAAGFSFLFISRLITIIFLAISSKNTLQLNPIFAFVFAALITPLVIFLFYSVKKYFTIDSAYGIDHFDKNYNDPYVKQGITGCMFLVLWSFIYPGCYYCPRPHYWLRYSIMFIFGCIITLLNDQIWWQSMAMRRKKYSNKHNKALHRNFITRRFTKSRELSRYKHKCN